MKFIAQSSAQLCSFLLCIALLHARLITFPPVSPALFQAQRSFSSSTLVPYADSINISSSPFKGLTTFANLPYAHCLSESKEIEKYDIAILGAPFDTGVTGRPGARFGPGAIRHGSWRISPDAAYDVETGFNPYLNGLSIIDCGDAPLTFLDNTVALQQLDKAHEIISGRPSNSNAESAPRIVTLGGDHTTTLSALRSTYKRWGRVSVIHFDSHIDTWQPSVLGGNISHYAGVNHGTFLHIAHEEGLIHNSSVHVGIRAPVNSRSGDRKNDERCGFEIIHARAIDRIGANEVVKKIRQRVNSDKVYISIDIDVLDPAYAPATGTPEVGGWSTRELLSILDRLEGLEVVGADVVEVAPSYDNTGETTALAAAEIVQNLLSLMVKAPIKVRLYDE